MHPKYQRVVNLRLKGTGYGTIAKTVGVSKNSVSRWCKDLKLPAAAQKKIDERIKYTQEKFKAYNLRRHKLVQVENKKIKETSIRQIHSLSNYELLLVGTALYWGEGWKKEGKGLFPYTSFANSDPDMIALFLRFLRIILKVPEEKIRATIHLYPSTSIKSSINFWSRVTGLPRTRFNIVCQISRASKRKRPRNSLPYGTLKLDVTRRQRFQQIKGWIDGLIRQT